jgi:hypothetical protein
MTRMEAALALADQCWGRANRTEPEFVEGYLELAEQLLLSKPAVTGDEFRDWCSEHGLHLPDSLHHNTWVSAVRAIQMVGWIEPICKIEPQKAHNHMPNVTLWRSCIFGEDPPHENPPVQGSLF